MTEKSNNSRVKFPREGPGVKSRMCPPYPQRNRKRRLIGAVCRNHRIKRVVPCRYLDGHVKEPYEMSMAWEPDRRSIFFFSPPAHLCTVTYMTEISSIVTLNNYFTHSCQIRWGELAVSRHNQRYFSHTHVTAHRCAGGLKKLDLRSSSQRHTHFAGIFNVPVQTSTRDNSFYTVIPTHRPI